MNNGEFYSSSEYNSVSEYAQFPAELYIKPKEENKSGNENADLGKETTTLQHKAIPKADNGNTKTLVDKIFNSIKTVAATATVAAAALVVTTSFVTNAPKVELVNLNCGADYVEYELEIDKLQEDVAYSIVVGSPKQEENRTTLTENGNYKNRIDGLKPDWEYTLSVVSEDTILGEVTHYQIKFQTLKYVDNEEPPLESEPETDPLPEPEATITINTEPQNSLLGYVSYYEVNIENEENGINYTISYEKDGVSFKEMALDSYSGEIDISAQTEFDIVIYVEFNDAKIEIGRTSFVKPAYTPPSVNISNVIISGLDEIQIFFTTNNIGENSEIEFTITYGDLSVNNLNLTASDLENGYVTTYMYSSNSLSIKPYVTTYDNGFERNTECDTHEHVFDSTLFVETKIGLTAAYSYKSVTFYPTGITNGAQNLMVISSEDPSTPELLWLGSELFIEYSSETEVTYTLYFANDEGDALSNEITVTLDTSVIAPDVDYTFNPVNTGDVGITYNDDGTINAYLNTNFACENEDIYYQVTLGRFRYQTREAIARIEGIPDETYPLIFDICFDVNGQHYSFYRTSLSGVVNEASVESYITSTISDNSLSLQFYSINDIYLDFNNLKAVSSTGEEIILSESMFTFDDINSTHELTIEFTQAFEYVTLYVIANPNYLDVKDTPNYSGNIRKTFEVVITP